MSNHANSVCVVDGFYTLDEHQSAAAAAVITYVASASSDSDIVIYNRQSDFNLQTVSDITLKSKFVMQQKINCKNNSFALALKFYLLPLSKGTHAFVFLFIYLQLS